MLSPQQLSKIRNSQVYDPVAMYEVLTQIISHVNRGDQLSKVDGSGQYPTPTPPSQLQVSAGTDGSVEYAVVDNSIVGKSQPVPLEYFVEYSSDPAFTNPLPLTVQAGVARNGKIFTGAGTFYFRVYSQYQGSNPSAPVVSGGRTPVGVVVTVGGGGAPASLPSQGTGSAAPGTSGAGFGVFARKV